MRIENGNQRSFYEIEAIKNNWSVRELQRQLDPEFYTRLSLCRDTKKVQEQSEKGLIIEQPQDAIKDPYILEFLGLLDGSFPEKIYRFGRPSRVTRVLAAYCSTTSMATSFLRLRASQGAL